MKKILFCGIVALAFPLWADSIDIKGGAFWLRNEVELRSGGTKREWNTGFDLALSYNLMVDKLLAVVPEVSLARVATSGSATTMDGSKIEYEQVTYLIPVMLNARLFLPMGELGMGEKPPFQPYVTVGLGYTAGEVQWENTQVSTVPGFSFPSTQKGKYGLNGLTYQAFLGSAITLDPTSAVEVLLEAGYRGANLKADVDGSKAKDFPGWVLRVGIRYSLGVTSNY